jgi:hypothetical protein
MVEIATHCVGIGVALQEFAICLAPA